MKKDMRFSEKIAQVSEAKEKQARDLMEELSEMLAQLLEVQMRILRELDETKQKTVELEKRVARFERSPEHASRELTPALVKVLAELNRIDGEADIAQIANRLKISRNIANAYLNKLVEMEYVSKLLNPDPTRKARYLYSLRKGRIDDRLRTILERMRE